MLVSVQVALGILSVASHLQIALVTAHLSVGALLWVDLIILYACLGERQHGEAAVVAPLRLPRSVSSS